MTVEDLEYIFRDQIGTTERLWFMLIEDDRKFVGRHPANDLPGLLPMLDCFQYVNSDYQIPRFVK